MGDSVLHETSYYELEPVMLDDQTEVKLPIVSNEYVTPISQDGPELTSLSSDHLSLQPAQPPMDGPSLQSAQLPLDGPSLQPTQLPTDGPSLQHTQLSMDGPSLQPAQHPFTQSIETPEADGAWCLDPVMDTANLDECNRLLTIFRRLPKDMCVHQILSDYNSDEVELDRIRCLLFESLKSNDDFPYDSNCTVKRRLRTRDGERLSVKLGKDIHVILSVLDGASYSDIKDIVSVCNTKLRSKSVSSQSVASSHVVSRTQCSCESEVKLLADKLCNIQADLLLTKQRQIAVENARSEEMHSLRKSLSETTSTISKFASDMSQQCNVLRVTLQSLGEKFNENQINFLTVSDSLTKLQSIVYNICKFVKLDEPKCENGTTSPGSAVSADSGDDVPHLITPVQSVKINDQNDHHASVQPRFLPCPPREDGNTSVLNLPEAEHLSASRLTCTDDIESHTQNQCNLKPKHGDLNINSLKDFPRLQPQKDGPRNTRKPVNTSGMPIPVVNITDRSKDRSKTNSDHDSSYRDTLLQKPSSDTQYKFNQNSSTSDRKRNKSRANSRLEQTLSDHENDLFVRNTRKAISRYPSPTRTEGGVVDLFAHVKRRKTKRYYVGGFLPTITEQEIKMFVTEKGPKVSKVTIFRNWRYNSATVRLNVFDDDSTGLLETPEFWPRFITCRPWVTHNQYRRSRDQNSDNFSRHSHHEHEEGHDNYNGRWDQQSGSYNRFSALPSEVD